MVLLDVGDGECDAVELEIGDAGGDFADEGLGSIIQLYSNGTDLFGAARELLSTWAGSGMFAAVVGTF